jgi:hypothetical protein
MTDEELVKRLRKGDTPMANHYMDEAADRIEALINLNEALVELMDDRDAKLAKAVEGLREIAGECGCSTARAIIAEIEGEKK